VSIIDVQPKSHLFNPGLEPFLRAAKSHCIALFSRKDISTDSTAPKDIGHCSTGAHIVCSLIRPWMIIFRPIAVVFLLDFATGLMDFMSMIH
jgi:hypothetical protein